MFEFTTPENGTEITPLPSTTSVRIAPDSTYTSHCRIVTTAEPRNDTIGTPTSRQELAPVPLVNHVGHRLHTVIHDREEKLLAGH
jgi:hypothetical protein